MRRFLSLFLCAAMVFVVLSASATSAYEDEAAVLADASAAITGTVTYGDANNSGAVSIADVSVTLKKLAKWTVDIDSVAADANADGTLNLLDAAIVLKYIAKWNVALGEGIYGERIITSADSVMMLRPEKERLLVTHLSTSESGESHVTEDSEYALPRLFWNKDNKKVNLSWEFTTSGEYDSVENGFAVNGYSFGFTDKANGFSLTVYCYTHGDIAGPFEFRTAITNTSADDAVLQPYKFASVTFDGFGEDATVFTVEKESGDAEKSTVSPDGGLAGNGGIIEVPLTDDVDEVAWANTNQQPNQNGFIPMIYVRNGDEGGVYAALEWTSGRILAEANDNGGFDLSADMDRIYGTASFMTNVASGDTFVFPTVYYGAYDGSLDNGANVFKAWYFDCKAPATLRDNTNEPQTQMDMQIGLDADTISVEAIKWDYGWWGTGTWIDPTFFSEPYEGSWELRNPAYIGVLNSYGCKTMAEFGALARERGLSWTVYTLLHDTVDQQGNPTDAMGEFNSVTHPEWFGNQVCSSGRHADLGNEACVEYLKGAMTDYFTKNNITTWRSDFEPISYRSDKANRHMANGSDVMYWCTVGFGDIVDHLYDNVPGFRYESCSSGGSLKDLFTASKAVVINCDDSANYLSLRTTFYDSTYMIHPTQLQIPVNVDTFNVDMPDSFYPNVMPDSVHNAKGWKDTMFDMGYRSMILGAPMFSSHTGNVNREYVKYYSEMYQNEVRPLARDGELYHILPRPDGTNWDGIMYADPDSANELKGLVFLFKPHRAAGDTYRVVMDGLFADKMYTLSFEDRPGQNCTLSGAALMSEGIDVEILGVGSEIIRITEAK